MRKHKVIILGGGLSGLATAYFLEKMGVESLIIEANSKLGGRIDTFTDGNGSVEYGATWFQRTHKHLISLLDELGIEYYPQYMGKKVLYDFGASVQTSLIPAGMESSLKIKGGSYALINTLAKSLQKSTIQPGELVSSVNIKDESVEVTTQQTQYVAESIISTLPPNLAVNSIAWFPKLPDYFLNIARQTHTWMGESVNGAIKVEKPYWRLKDIGSIFSQYGPFTELHDHSHPEESSYYLKGFINPKFMTLSFEERRDLVYQQLQRITMEDQPISFEYIEKAWDKAPFTYYPYQNNVYAHQNNGNPIFQKVFYGDKIIFAGAETATQHAGYMDGAVESAFRAAHQTTQAEVR